MEKISEENKIEKDNIEALKGINKDLTVRAESLTIEDFVYISNYLKEK